MDIYSRGLSTRTVAIMITVILVSLAGLAAANYGDVRQEVHQNDVHQNVHQEEHHSYDTNNGYSSSYNTHGPSSHDSDYTRAEQYVRSRNGDIHVERSVTGDGAIVEQDVEPTEDGYTARQYMYKSSEATVKDGKKMKKSKKTAGEGKYPKTPGDGGSNGETADNQTDGTDDNQTDDGPTNGSDDDDGQNGSDDINGNQTEDTDENNTNGGTNNGENGDGAGNGNGDGVSNGDGNGAGNGGVSDGDQTDDNVTVIDSNQTNQTDGNASNEITSLTPPEGARLLGNQYQTPPRDTGTQPPVVSQPRQSMWDRILGFFRGIFAGIQNWFARVGSL